MKKLITILLVLIIMTAFTAFAADSVDDEGNLNDPVVNGRANACYDGGAWEGKCGDNDALWEAGWYYIRLEAGIFSEEDIPDWVYWIIPNEGTEIVAIEEIEVVLPTGCVPWFISSYYVQVTGSQLVQAGDSYWTNSACAGVPSTITGHKWAYTTNKAEADTLCGNPSILDSGFWYNCK